MQILNLEKGLSFRMGKGQNRRVVHPDMGAKQLTLNYSIYAPGHEFPQHIHDESEDVFIVLEGEVSVRQGDVLTPISAGDAVFIPSREVHGTVNTSNQRARLISFQSPPDMALYRGERDLSPEKRPKPLVGHRSAVQIVTMSKGGPVFGKPGDWRSVVSAEKGAKRLALDYITLKPDEGFEHEPGRTEEIYVLTSGDAKADTKSGHWDLKTGDVIFLSPDDTFILSASGAGPTALIRCFAQGG